MFMVLTSWFLWHCFQVWDMKVMAVLWATTSDIKGIESRFLWNFVMWMKGMGRCLVLWMWSLVLGTLASIQSCSSSQIYSQCSTSAGKKNDHGVGTKSSNKTLSFFFRDPNTCWDHFDHINLRPTSFRKTYIGFSLQKYFFLHSCWVK